MKKKLLWCIGIVVTLVLIALGLFRYIEVQHRQTDPNWTLAEQIYNMENALKEVDKDYLCWTISPEISCVIEYSADVNAEADIFRIAESVQVPA